MCKEKIQYFLLCLFIYLMLNIIDAFIISMFVGYINIGNYVYYLAYILLYLFVNPFITKTIIDKFVFF